MIAFFGLAFVNGIYGINVCDSNLLVKKRRENQ